LQIEDADPEKITTDRKKVAQSIISKLDAASIAKISQASVALYSWVSVLLIN